MAAKLSHEPGPLGSEARQHELPRTARQLVAKNNDPNEPAGTHNSMAPAAGHTEPYEYNLGSPPTAGTTPSRAYNSGKTGKAKGS